MGYAYTFSEFTSPNNTSYAALEAVQSYITTYKIANDDSGNVRQIHEWLIQVTRELDAAMLKAGVQVPPPDNTAIQVILQETAAVGAAALLAYARMETGDESMNAHANALMNAYDAQLGLIERGDIPLILMGCLSNGWAITDDRRKYYFSGNLDLDRTGNTKKPFFTAQDIY